MTARRLIVLLSAAATGAVVWRRRRSGPAPGDPPPRTMTRSTLWDRLRYSIYAPFYDPVVRRLDAGRRRSLALADLQPGERVLIPGCGTGLDFPHLPPGLDVVAGDVAPGMNRAARATADRLGLDIDVRPLDAHRLDVADDAFDVVVLHLLLAVVPDPEAAIAEAARVLRPGGRVAVFDKFLPDGERPSLGRRLASGVARVVATDLNRQLGPLLRGAGLVLTHREPVLFGGLFQAALASHPADASSDA